MSQDGYIQKYFHSFFFLVGLEFELSAYTLAKQVPYHLSHTSSPFYSGYFGDRGQVNGFPTPASSFMFFTSDVTCSDFANWRESLFLKHFFLKCFWNGIYCLYLSYHRNNQISFTVAIFLL
jgi:hypothetical protein